MHDQAPACLLSCKTHSSSTVLGFFCLCHIRKSNEDSPLLTFQVTTNPQINLAKSHPHGRLFFFIRKLCFSRKPIPMNGIFKIFHVHYLALQETEMGEIIICFHECYFFHKDCSMKKGFEDRLQQKLSKKIYFKQTQDQTKQKKTSPIYNTFVGTNIQQLKHRNTLDCCYDYNYIKNFTRIQGGYIDHSITV